MINIAADVEQRPKQKRACAEILNDLSGLSGDRGEAFAIGRISEVSEFFMRETEPLGRSAEKEDALDEKRKAAESEDERNRRELGFRRREYPKAYGSSAEAQIKHRAPRMVFQVASKVFQKEFANCHCGSLPQKS